MFKSINKQIKELGFKAIEENEFVCEYERSASLGWQVVTLSKRNDGRHTILTFLYLDDDNSRHLFPLTAYETDVFIKKMKKLGWYKDTKTLAQFDAKLRRRKKKYEYTIHKLYKRTCN